jgi:hypothetical protein
MNVHKSWYNQKPFHLCPFDALTDSVTHWLHGPGCPWATDSYSSNKEIPFLYQAWRFIMMFKKA